LCGYVWFSLELLRRLFGRIRPFDVSVEEAGVLILSAR
jgi:hypothetical protein